ncbi:MAG: hypothetical protein JW913_15575, partial [Chitinispirillaceae bacterium]|nr:hypothetical protein [Chitinispirillaceae bacterium]
GAVQNGCFDRGGARDKTLLRKGVPLHLRRHFRRVAATSPHLDILTGSMQRKLGAASFPC